MDILGVRVDNLIREEILEKISYFLDEKKFHQVATVNPEFILEAGKNKEFEKILNACDLNVADGIGIKFAFWKFGEKLKCRITGIDLLEEVLKLANNRGLGVFLAANNGGLSSWEETRDAILKKYPNLSIEGENIDRNNPEYRIKDSGSQLLFSNFGAPFQEKFLNFQKDGRIILAVGVGGSFDYLTGKLIRAPKWMQFFGIEWFWRLILQPRRIKRIWNAVIVFPVKILCHKKEK